MTISRGGTARNLLQSDCFSALKASGNTLVIIAPANESQTFQKLCDAPNVHLEKMVELPWRWTDRMLVGIHKGLIYNKSTIFRDKFGIYDPKEGSMLKYWMRKIFISPFSKSKSLKRLARKIDKVVAPARHYDEIFSKYKPDVLFSTSMIEDQEVEIMKQAEAHNVPIIAMPKTWDNPSKINLRVKPNKVIVWGDYSKDEVMKYSAINEKNIEVCGIPQFDAYRNIDLIDTREDFCAKWGFDPNKKIIVFGSEGRITPQDKDIAEQIATWVKDGDIENAQLFVRPHFMYPEDLKKFKNIESQENVKVDNSWNRIDGFRDNWDYSMKQISHFANLMVHADLMITTGSTLSIDAAATDTPVINIYFDTPDPKPFNESIRRWYTSEHYTHVLKTGAVSLAHSMDELKEYTKRYLKTPSIRQQQRKNLIEEFGYKNDGKSAQRIASAVLDFISEGNGIAAQSSVMNVSDINKIKRHEAEQRTKETQSR